MPCLFRVSTKVAPSGAALVERLLEEDGPADVLPEPGGAQEELAVLAAVSLGVLHADRVQALPAGPVGLVHGEDALAGRGDGVGRGDELLVEGPGAADHRRRRAPP